MERGVTILKDDFSEEWLPIFRESGLNTLSLHFIPKEENTETFLAWLEQENTRRLTDVFTDAGVSVNYKLHALEWLLPRNLFHKNAEYFRFDGVRRVNDCNMCVSSSAALEIVSENAYLLAKKLRQPSSDYSIWADDGTNNICQCEKCRNLSASDQVMLITNAIGKGLKAYDSNAKISFLAYADANALPAIKPEENVFLEFAPFYRNLKEPLEGESEKNKFYAGFLKDLLAIFSVKTVKVLEYWLDVSLACGWERSAMKELETEKQIVLRDVEFYTGIGIEKINTFAAFIDKEYFHRYGKRKITELCLVIAGKEKGCRNVKKAKNFRSF